MSELSLPAAALVALSATILHHSEPMRTLGSCGSRWTAYDGTRRLPVIHGGGSGQIKRGPQIVARIYHRL